MFITGNNRFSRLTTCLEAASHFLLGEDAAKAMINAQLETIRTHWQAVCDEAGLNEVNRNFLWGRQFLNPYALQDWPDAS